MTVSLRSLFGCVSFAVATSVVTAQSPPPIVELPAPEATSTDHFGTILNVRQLADGRLLVNDGQRRQLSMLDAQLGHRIVAIDSVVVGGQGYGRFAATMIPYLADSTLFVDREAQTLLVIGPSGNVVRAMAPPGQNDLSKLNTHPSGIDANGSLIYQGSTSMGSNAKLSVEHTDSTSFDSLPVVRANAETRRVDTLTMVAVTSGMRLHSGAQGDRTTFTLRSSPVSYVDDWAVLSDFTLLIIRGHDYHAEWFAPTGDHGVGLKLPFDWKRLTDDDKQRLVDSARTARAKEAAKRPPHSGIASGRETPLITLPGNNGYAMIVASPTSSSTVALVEEDVPLSEIPDYWPPLRPNAAKADLDNHLWILPTTSAQSKNGELVYDVVNDRGEMTERVRIPAGRSIAGFGRNGVVYLMHRDDSGWVIEKTKVVH